MPKHVNGIAKQPHTTFCLLCMHMARYICVCECMYVGLIHLRVCARVKSIWRKPKYAKACEWHCKAATHKILPSVYAYGQVCMVYVDICVCVCV